jgi:tRNA(fMet)-specific endonuclease VapC
MKDKDFPGPVKGDVGSKTISELYYGAEKIRSKKRNVTVVENFISHFDIIPFDDKCCKIYGKIGNSAEKEGVPIGPMDLLIVSIGLANDLILVTNNTKEFGRIKGLKIENWI